MLPLKNIAYNYGFELRDIFCISVVSTDSSAKHNGAEHYKYLDIRMVRLLYTSKRDYCKMNLLNSRNLIVSFICVHRAFCILSLSLIINLYTELGTF